jgi:hypothetical protein
MSEVLGRRIPLFAGFFLFAIFQIPVAVAQNMATICVGRFLGGFFAAAPLSVVGGALADLWDPIPRSYAICIFAAGGFAGPVAGPIAGGFITESSLGWRWTSWITLIMAAFFGVIGWFVIPETSAARILQTRAKKMRKDTGDKEYHAKADLQKLTPQTIMTVYLIRPFKMLVQEPILALMTAYMSYLYGIVYLLFEAVSPLPNLCPKRCANKTTVSRFLPRRAPLEPRYLATPVHSLHRRYPSRSRTHRIQRRYKLHARLQQARQSHTRGAPSAHDHWGHCPPHRPLLVWLDLKPEYLLGALCARNCADRFGMHGAVLAGNVILDRLLRFLCQFGHCGQHLHSELLRRLLPTVHACNVHETWCTVGKQSFGLHLRRFLASACSVLHLWSENTREEQMGSDCIDISPIS